MSGMIESILVTGAAGLVGRHVTERLRSRGVHVVAHARRAGPGIDWAVDLTDPRALHDPMRFDVAAVVHCAAAIPARSDNFDRDNTIASATLAAALSAAKSLRRIVHLSSVSVYQQPATDRWLIDEDAPTVDGDVSDGSYAASKRAAERSLDFVRQDKPDVAVTHLRASSIYGPGMVGTTLLPILVARAQRNEPLVMRGPRPYRQNFIHVADVAELAVALVQENRSPAVVNAFSDDTHEIAALAELVRTRLGSCSRIVDESYAGRGPEPVFVNRIAKRLHPFFRSLADHLSDAS
ncbi:NAD(P)-dependent oxidoreductase [Mycobacterium simiae]|uniref:NAD(P)-dependent oxidoreductase n=1 Tax=Mycobacterium simiae TaxID=1784 RepID=A0A5B1BX51_MYCSI|nr:NAD(P)-dependent oxidoreductase [Mycobacterium simiae]KAA1251990.1 NAD(P)-dependent oxidoreductase [Mycobacterium simiae]